MQLTWDISVGNILTIATLIVTLGAVIGPLLKMIRRHDDTQRRVDLMWSVFKQRFQIKENGEPLDPFDRR